MARTIDSGSFETWTSGSKLNHQPQQRRLQQMNVVVVGGDHHGAGGPSYIVDQNGQRVFGAALAGLNVTENVVATQGPTLTGGGSWSRNDNTITSTDTFVDLLNQAPYTNATTLANQTFYINGTAVPIIGFGSAWRATDDA